MHCHSYTKWSYLCLCVQSHLGVMGSPCIMARMTPYKIEIRQQPNAAIQINFTLMREHTNTPSTKPDETVN